MMETVRRRNGQTSTLGKAILATAMIAASLLFAPLAGAQSDHASLLPEDAAERSTDIQERLGIERPWRNASGAINPDDFECGQTDFGNRIGEVFRSINPEALDFVFGYGVDIWPEVYTVAFDNDPSDTEIGANGEHTREQVKRHKDNRRFWDVETNDIQLHGMHGSDIADDAKMVPVVSLLFGVTREDAQEIVDHAQWVIENEPTLDYDHPVFSFNAFAVPGFEDDEVGVIPDKIVMGDGLLEVVGDIGLGGIGPDLIHAHEFAHHVQFEIGAFDTEITDPAEATRRTELMADAFAGYNLAHARGASFQTKRIVDTVAISFNAGDCGFDFPGHHGTPNQRAAAAEWGADLAQDTRPRGKILSANALFDLFEDELPSIVAPDAN